MLVSYLVSWARGGFVVEFAERPGTTEVFCTSTRRPNLRVIIRLAVMPITPVMATVPT